MKISQVHVPLGETAGEPSRLSRRGLAGLVACALVLPAFGAPVPDAAARQHAATPATAADGLAVKGVSYETGTFYPEWDGLSRPDWDAETVERDLAAIRNDLHCTAVTLFGSEVARLVDGATMALDQGLAVWIQPRLFDAERDALLDHLTEVARKAERLRADGADITLNVGVELSLFSTGIIPGATFEERIPTLLETPDQLPVYNEALNDLLASATATARDVFSGPLTYGSGEWEAVDWSGFDIVGVDLYRGAYNRETYVDSLRSYHRFGKPVVITEFGCCTYEGAEDAGGSGYAIVDWEQDPPQLNGDYVRSEVTQAETIGDLYEVEGIHGAFVYTFVEPQQTYSPDPRYDLDMASFGIVKVFPEDSGQGYGATGYWEPKEAFRVITEHFAGT